MRGVRLAMNRRWPAVEEGEGTPRERAAEEIKRWFDLGARAQCLPAAFIPGPIYQLPINAVGKKII
jgi:hypothetical protein